MCTFDREVPRFAEIELHNLLFTTIYNKPLFQKFFLIKNIGYLIL